MTDEFGVEVQRSIRRSQRDLKIVHRKDIFQKLRVIPVTHTTCLARVVERTSQFVGPFVRRGTGTFVVKKEGSPALDSDPLRLMASLRGFTINETFEARKALEMAIAGLAADRATGEQLAQMSEEIAEMFASLDDPAQYLVHDMRFHQTIAAASGNRILTSLMNMLATLLLDVRSKTVNRAKDLKESAEMHRNIYSAIRKRDVVAATAAMRDHLLLAEKAQACE